MPRPGYCWWHIILTTHGAWLHGEPRGFRSRGHRIHSSGDYKNRPPKGEHEGLYRFHVKRSRHAVLIPKRLYEVVGQRIVDKAEEQGYRLLVLSVAVTHVHALVELPDDYKLAKRVAGSWKQASSHAVRQTLPGRVWAEGGVPIDVRSRPHQTHLYQYILDHAAREGAWVWQWRNEGRW